MAGAARTYTAIFAIGARVLGSFKGAMASAQARLRALAVTARTVSLSLAKVAAGLITGAAAAAGTLIGTLLAKIFYDALSNAEQVADHQRKMLAYLRTDTEFRKKGNAYIENQLRLLDQYNEALAAQSVLSSDIYGAAQETLITYGAMPDHLAKIAGPLGNMLVAMKGPRATMEDMSALADQVGRAIIGGPTLQLERMGLQINKTTKEWQKMSREARFKEVMKALKQFDNEANRAMTTPIGKVVMFQRSMDDLSTEVGEILLPILGDTAEALRKMLVDPVLRPVILNTMKAIGKAIEWAAKKLGEFLKWASANSGWLVPTLKHLVIVLGAVSAAIFTINTALALTPLGIAVVAIVALGYGAYQLNKHLDDLRARKDAIGTVARALQAFQTWLDPFVDSFKKNFVQSWVDLTKNLKDFQTFLDPWVDNFRKNFVQSWVDLADNVQKFINLTKPAREGVKAIGSGIWEQIKGAASYGAAPQAAGGIIRRPTFSMVGEAGPEAIIPLSGGRGAQGLLAYANRALGMGGGGGTNLNFAPVVNIAGNAGPGERQALDGQLRTLAKDFIANFKAAQQQERRLSYESGYS